MLGETPEFSVCQEVFVAMIRRLFHASVVLFLLPCLASPFVEVSLHMTGTVFGTGKDTETSLALLIVVLGLVLALTSLLVAVQPGVRMTELLQPAARVVLLRAGWVLPILNPSPPPPLRI
jgi:hypothetical protein